MNTTHIPMCRKWLAAALAGLAVLMGSTISQQAFAQTNDYDTDNDNLIEVRSLEQLNAIRYDLDGNGTASNPSDYANAFPRPATSMGCPETCEGYELMANLDFNTDGEDGITSNDNVLSWGGGLGWQPLGTFSNPFTAEFHGNGHTISHLFIHRTSTNYVGLFGAIDAGAVIRSVGLIGVDVTGLNFVGGLAGRVNQARIHASYATGEVSGNNDQIGGLAGQIGSGTIRASYVTGVVSGDQNIGGLVGRAGIATIVASYAASEVSGDALIGGFMGSGNVGSIRASYAIGEAEGRTSIGGLVGSGSIPIPDSYFDTDTSGLTSTEGTSTVVLQSPTDYTGIYANWNVDLDNADSDSNLSTGGDDPWDFGTNEQYPVLQVDFNGDGVKSWEEFGPQSRPGVFSSPGALSLMEGTTGSYTVVLLTTPTASVMVTPGSDNPAAVSVNGGVLTFMMNNWDEAQTVAVSAADGAHAVDEVVSLMHTVASDDSNYGSMTPRNVTVRVIDPDAGVSVLPKSLSLMEGEMTTYTVALLSTPTDSVRVTPESSNTMAVTVQRRVTFTTGNWDMAQTVTVSALHDVNTASEEVSLRHTVTSTDPNYASAAPPVVTVNVTDNNARIDVSPGELPLAEGSTGSYTIVLLTAPTESVMVTPGSENSAAVSVVSSGTTLTFTNMNWSMPQTVTVSAEEGDDHVISRKVSLMHTVASDDSIYASAVPPVVTVNVTDNDSPVAVSTGTLSLTEGTTGSYTVVLLGMPTTPSVTVTPVVAMSSGNTTAVRVSGPLIFTDSNWGTEQTVMVGAVDDINTASEVVMLTHTVSEVPNYAPAFPPVVVTVNVEDDDGGIRVRVRVFLEGPLR